MAKAQKIGTAYSKPPALTPLITDSARQPVGWLWIAGWAALLTGVLIRVIGLGWRGLHHDESIHATFSFQWMEGPSTAYYKFDPTYHGPFLYTCVRALFETFGVGVAQARLFPLIFGLACVFSPLLLRRWIGARAAWLAVLALAISPLQSFYSRFLAHDMPSIFFAMVSLVAWWRYREGSPNAKRWLTLSFCAMGLLFSVKAVSFLYVFIFATGHLFLTLAERRQHGRPLVTGDDVGLWRERLRGWAFWEAFLIGLFCYALIQTSLFSHPQGFIDGVWTKSLAYWWGQHSVERLGGPTIFHLRSMLLHELPIALIVAAFGGWLLWTSGRASRVMLGVLGVVFLATVPFGWKLIDVVPAPVFIALNAVRLRASADIFLYCLAFAYGIVGAWCALRRGDRVTAFLFYWAFAALAIFSYAGEKTPWLSLHVAFPAALLAGVAVARAIDALGLAPFLERRGHAGRWNRRQWAAVIFGVLALAYQLRLAYYVNFVTAGEPYDLLSQVHNTKDVQYVTDWMRRVAMESGDKPARMRIAVIGEVTWAFYFYMIVDGYKNFALDAKSLDGKERFVITDEKAHREVEKTLTDQGYRQIRLVHSGWWVPEHGKVGWDDWLEYAWTRKPRNATGTTPLFVFYKPL